MHETGLIALNPAKLLKVPKAKEQLAQRILTQEQVVRMIALETTPRDHAMMRLMYATGLRVSEVVALTWSDIVARDNGAGQATVYGKGGKTRYILIPASIMDELRGLDSQEGAVFKSRKDKTAMDVRQATRIVTQAADRAGIDKNVSAHWLRHANASHALDNGATIAVVQSSLGHASLVTTSKYTHAKPSDGTANYINI